MNLPKSSGIYMILNKANAKCYIGQSEDVKRRVDAHERALRHNTHYNKHLQSAWNKYGADSFEFTMLEFCPEELLDEREVYYIETYNSFNNGYNMNIGGSSNRGYKHTDESKQKMAESHPDVSGENNPMYGHAVQEFMTQDGIKKWKHNISMAVSGDKNPFYGKTHSDETRKKISVARKGKLVGESNPRYGQRLSKEQKEHLSDARKLYIEQNPRFRYLHSTKVYCLSTNELFDSIADAARKYSISGGNISTCCSGKVNYAGVNDDGVRLVWVYHDDFLNMSKKEVSERIHIANHSREGRYSGKSKSVICLNTGEVFESARIAAKARGLDNSSICKACKGTIKYCGRDSDGTPLRWAFHNTDEDNVSNCV